MAEPLTPGDAALEGLFCDACGRDANDVADEDFWMPTEAAQANGYLSGRCQRHPPEDRGHFQKVHVGVTPDEAA
jgi:hypothetical protein